MMTDTLVGVSPPTPEPVAPAESESSGGSERELSPAELAVIEGLVRRAREDGVALTGPAGLGADSGGQRNSRGPICSIGFLKSKRLRGRSLSSAATQSRSWALCTERSLLFGKCCRSRPLVFSFVARCQGAWGSQKKMSMSASTATCFQWPISGPWSQVSDARSTSGRVLIFAR